MIPDPFAAAAEAVRHDHAGALIEALGRLEARIDDGAMTRTITLASKASATHPRVLAGLATLEAKRPSTARAIAATLARAYIARPPAITGHATALHALAHWMRNAPDDSAEPAPSGWIAEPALAKARRQATAEIAAGVGARERAGALARADITIQWSLRTLAGERERATAAGAALRALIHANRAAAGDRRVHEALDHAIAGAIDNAGQWSAHDAERSCAFAASVARDAPHGPDSALQGALDAAREEWITALRAMGGARALARTVATTVCNPRRRIEITVSLGIEHARTSPDDASPAAWREIAATLESMDTGEEGAPDSIAEAWTRILIEGGARSHPPGGIDQDTRHTNAMIGIARAVPAHHAHAHGPLALARLRILAIHGTAADAASGAHAVLAHGRASTPDGASHANGLARTVFANTTAGEGAAIAQALAGVLATRHDHEAGPEAALWMAAARAGARGGIEAQAIARWADESRPIARAMIAIGLARAAHDAGTAK